MSVTLLVSGMFDHKAQTANHKPQTTTHKPQRITEVTYDVNADPKKCPGPDEVTLYAKGVTCDV